MGKLFLPRHGHTHCPGGSDPIPCLPGAPWVMLYDNVPAGLVVEATDWDTAPNDVIRLKYNNGVNSDTSEQYFEIGVEDDPSYGIGENYYVILKRSGVYTVSLWVRWFEPDINNFTLGHSFWVGETSASHWSFPGMFSGGFTSLYQETATYNLTGYTSWTQNVHAFNHMIPISIHSPSDPVKCRLWTSAYHYHPAASPSMEVILNARLFVRYEGVIPEGVTWDAGYPD
jgi:hypothetical protein